MIVNRPIRLMSFERRLWITVEEFRERIGFSTFEQSRNAFRDNNCKHRLLDIIHGRSMDLDSEQPLENGHITVRVISGQLTYQLSLIIRRTLKK